MSEIKKRTFASPLDFFSKFFAMFKGESILSTFFNSDPKFREKLLLTVSIANNCAA